MEAILRHTALAAWHRAHGARMVPFAGWEMPLHYGSQLAEHQAVRQSAGLFDVGHMRPLDVEGADARAFLRRALANDVARLDETWAKGGGRALYGTLLQPDGGIIDDLIVYALGPAHYRIVLNAAGALPDTAQLQAWIADWTMDVRLRPREDWGILACQGPLAVSKVAEVLGLTDLSGLGRFRSTIVDAELFIGRTGYTGEDGVELMGTHQRLLDLADALLAQGVVPVGLAARDSLRLEAGLNLYGQDMTQADSPDRSNLGWTVDLRDPARDFVGRQAVEKERAQGHHPRLWGLVLPDGGIPRTGCVVERSDRSIGQITSGLFSPSLQRGIALARLDADVQAGDGVTVTIRGQAQMARVMAPPFWRQGKASSTLEEAMNR